jgi:4-amino-4-deoxy-L-arabinose transferase-like glycosyltransferase
LQWVVLAAILATAFGVRVFYGLVVDGRPYWSPIFDGSWYDRVARDIAAGLGVRDASGEPTAFFPPGYPALLAAAYSVFGARYEVARVLNALFATATCFFTYAIGRRLYGHRVGLGAAAILALMPGDVFYTSLTLSEPAFTAMLTGCIYAFLVWSRSGTPSRRWFLFGLLLGLAALVRGIALLYLSVPILVWILTLGWSRETLRRSALAALGLALAIAPWTIRNHLVMGYPILIASDGPNALIIAHSPIADGSQSAEIWEYRREQYGEILELENPAAEVEMAKADLRHGLRYMLTHPRHELALIPKRLAHLFRHDHYAFRFSTVERSNPKTGARYYRLRPRHEQRKTRRLADGFFFCVLALAAAGLTRVSSRPMSAGLVVPLTPLFFAFAQGVLFWGDARFHAPFVPTLVLLAAVVPGRGLRPWRIPPRNATTAG